MAGAHRFRRPVAAVLAGFSLTAAGLAAVAGHVAGPAVAAAIPPGTVAVSRACYVNTARAAAKITITGAGWQAGATIQLTDTLTKLSATATATSAGTFSTTVPAPVVDSDTASQVADQIQASYAPASGETTSPGGATATSARFETTNYVVLITGHSHNPDVRRTFALSGFAPHRTVYAHYLSARGKLLTSESFGTPTGACGLRRVSAYEYPGGHPQRGTYTIQFDDSARYAKATQPQYRLSFSVGRA
jgi:hypothetical protein